MIFCGCVEVGDDYYEEYLDDECQVDEESRSCHDYLVAVAVGEQKEEGGWRNK